MCPPVLLVEKPNGTREDWNRATGAVVKSCIQKNGSANWTLLPELLTKISSGCHLRKGEFSENEFHEGLIAEMRAKKQL
jgi:hypothetical protein